MNKLLRFAPFAALVLGGCSHAFREPEVNLVKVTPNGIGLRGGSVAVQLEVHNPNSFGLRTERINYNFEVLDNSKSDTSWVSVSKGVIDKSLEVGGGDRTIIEIPIDFRYDDFGAAARSIMDRGSFRYRVSGDVQLREPLKRLIPFRKTDTFNLSIIR
ncbi:MAG: LEA type 2 family protein [Longimicrobiales bacterium]